MVGASSMPMRQLKFAGQSSPIPPMIATGERDILKPQDLSHALLSGEGIALQADILCEGEIQCVHKCTGLVGYAIVHNMSMEFLPCHHLCQKARNHTDRVPHECIQCEIARTCPVSFNNRTIRYSETGSLAARVQEHRTRTWDQVMQEKLEDEDEALATVDVTQIFAAASQAKAQEVFRTPKRTQVSADLGSPQQIVRQERLHSEESRMLNPPQIAPYEVMEQKAKRFKPNTPQLSGTVLTQSRPTGVAPVTTASSQSSSALEAVQTEDSDNELSAAQLKNAEHNRLKALLIKAKKRRGDDQSLCYL